MCNQIHGVIKFCLKNLILVPKKIRQLIANQSNINELRDVISNIPTGFLYIFPKVKFFNEKTNLPVVTEQTPKEPWGGECIFVGFSVQCKNSTCNHIETAVFIDGDWFDFINQNK